MYAIDDHRVAILGGRSKSFDSEAHFIWDAWKDKWIWFDTPVFDYGLSSHAGFIMDNSLNPSLCQNDVPFQPDLCLSQTEGKFVYTFGGVYNSKVSLPLN
jgi:hypothetical protein